MVASHVEDQTQSESPTNSDMMKVLAAIAESYYLTSRIDEVKVDSSLIRQDMQKLRETETRISVIEDSIAPVPQDIHEL